MDTNYKDGLDDLVARWEKAQADGIFANAPKAHVPSAQTQTDGFFGSHEGESSERIDESDASYWRRLANLADTHSFKEAVITQKDRGDMASAVATAANPIRHSSTGADQDMTDKSLGNTFTPEDIEALADLKLKLHDLESNLAKFEGRGENGKKYESQITETKKKINELSELLNKGWTISQQGD